LGVEPDATPDQIKAAYRARARVLHPDRNGEAGAAAMAEANEAFRVLRDPFRRAAYDAQLTGTSPGAFLVDPYDDTDEPITMLPVARPLRGFPVVLAAVVTVFVFVAVALFAKSNPTTDDPVDGVVQVGSCVAVANGGVVAEVSCNGRHDGTVAELVSFDQDCPAGTLTFANPAQTIRVCMRPSS
jgi:hypothetical protein